MATRNKKAAKPVGKLRDLAPKRGVKGGTTAATSTSTTVPSIPASQPISPDRFGVL